MEVRPIDAEKYMDLLKEQYLHHKSMGNNQAAKAWQGAMQLLYDMPTLTPPNEALRCTGCMYLDEDFVPCVHCVRAAGYADYYRRPPEGEEHCYG